MFRSETGARSLFVSLAIRLFVWRYIRQSRAEPLVSKRVLAAHEKELQIRGKKGNRKLQRTQFSKRINNSSHIVETFLLSIYGLLIKADPSTGLRAINAALKPLRILMI